MNSIAILVARILLALIFLLSAFRQMKYRQGLEQEMAAHGMVCTPLILGCATLWGALELIAFTLAATFIYYRRILDRDKLIHVLKNLAIIGGLLMIAAVGPGAIVISRSR